jgi:programmed cell death 6-interacting protein
MHQADLEVLVPSSTISTPSHEQSSITQTHARALRVLLESLDDLILTRAKFVQRAQHLADADDIGPRILKVAAGFARWVELKPAMFSDVSDEELAKYDKFISGIEEGRNKQDGILQDIEA